MWARCHGMSGSAGGKGCGVYYCQVTASVGYAKMCGAEAGGDAAGRAGGRGEGGGGGAARQRGRRLPGSWR